MLYNNLRVLCLLSLGIHYTTMARQKSLVRLEGTISGINFYFRKGKPVAREAGGGFSSEAIRTSPKMERVRENSGEFGMVSKAKKLIRLGLYPFLLDYADVSLHGRMMRLFQAIKVLDTISVRGQRTFQNGLATAAGRSLLLHFDITAQKASTMLPGKGHFDATTQQYTLTNIKPDTLLLPKGATGMQLCFGVLQVDFAASSFSFFSSAPLIRGY